MAPLQNQIPMYWPGGPLDIARQQKEKGFTPETRQTLERWIEPAALEILKDTPINCLVLNWAAGLPEDRQQWKAAGPLLAAARQRNLSVIGWVEGSADAAAAIASAKSAGLAAVAIKGFKGNSDFTVIPWSERASANLDAKAPVLPVTDNAWPGILGQQGGGSNAGPTGTPWVESNGWYVQLAQARTEVPVWLMFNPPAQGNVVRGPSYSSAVLDAESWGGRWVLSLDNNLRAALLKGDAAARQTLGGISSVIRFYEKHREWKTYRPAGVAGVISDFAGENFDMSGEILKLSLRRGLLSRPLWKSRLTAQSFTGLKGLVYTDKQPPSADLRKRMMAFVEQGGFLASGPRWGPEGKTAGAHPRFDVRALGKGRLAIAKEELVDPYQAAVDIQGIFSRANDLVRMFNGTAAGGVNYTTSPDGKKALVQVLNYSGGGRGGGAANVTLWMRRGYRSARLWSVAGTEAAPLKAVSADGGYEYHIDLMPSFAAIEFEV
jgi:hypothetical protein